MEILAKVKRKLGLEKDRREWLLEMMPRNAVCAEIGVLWGVFSRAILKVTKPKTLHLIDPWAYREDLADELYGNRSKSTPESMDKIYDHIKRRLGKRPNVRIHRLSSQEAVELFSDNYFDWIYIDGDHRYEPARADLERYHAKVKAGGLVAGDDYAWGKKTWFQDGVTRAVDEVLLTGMYERVLISPAQHQFILRVVKI